MSGGYARRAAVLRGVIGLMSYGGTAAALWWEQVRARLERADNPTVVYVPLSASQGLAKPAGRTMELHCTIHEGLVAFGDDAEHVEMANVKVYPAWGGKRRSSPRAS